MCLIQTIIHFEVKHNDRQKDESRQIDLVGKRTKTVAEYQIANIESSLHIVIMLTSKLDILYIYIYLKG
jgi:hypothetical protein